MTDDKLIAIQRTIPERRVDRYDDTLQDILRKAFDQVCTQGDWKGPINAVVPVQLVDMYIHAIKFMTATDPILISNTPPGFVRLVSVGYRAGPAGDH